MGSADDTPSRASKRSSQCQCQPGETLGKRERGSAGERGVTDSICETRLLHNCPYTFTRGGNFPGVRDARFGLSL